MSAILFRRIQDKNMNSTMVTGDAQFCSYFVKIYTKYFAWRSATPELVKKRAVLGIKNPDQRAFNGSSGDPGAVNTQSNAAQMRLVGSNFDRGLFSIGQVDYCHVACLLAQIDQIRV